MVLDRLFLWIFTVAVLVGTAGIILQAPTLYDDRQPLDVQLSEIGLATARPMAGVNKEWFVYDSEANKQTNKWTDRQLLDVQLSEIWLSTDRTIAGVNKKWFVYDSEANKQTNKWTDWHCLTCNYQKSDWQLQDPWQELTKSDYFETKKHWWTEQINR